MRNSAGRSHIYHDHDLSATESQVSAPLADLDSPRVRSISSSRHTTAVGLAIGSVVLVYMHKDAVTVQGRHHTHSRVLFFSKRVKQVPGNLPAAPVSD